MKHFVAREENSEFVLIPHLKMLMMRDANGIVTHEYNEREIDGQSFEMVLNVEGNNQIVKFKDADQPIWSIQYISEKANEDIRFLVHHVEGNEEKESKSLMIGKDVLFRSNGGEKKGIIVDKVNIPIATNPPRGYCPMDNYIIIDDEDSVHTVNPIDVYKIVNMIPTTQN